MNNSTYNFQNNFTTSTNNNTTNPFSQTKTNNSTTNNYSFGNWSSSFNTNWSIGNKEKPYADQNALLDDSPAEVQKMLVEIFTISQKYDSKKNITQGESFGLSMNNLEDSLENIISHSIPNLTREVDYGQDLISEYRSTLEESEALFLNTKSQNSRPRIFLEKYYHSLQNKFHILNDSINNLNESFEKFNRSHKEKNFEKIISMIISENDSVVCAASRVYRLREKAHKIEAKLSEYKKFESIELFSENRKSGGNSAFSMSLTSKFLYDHKRHVEERMRDFEKRITDRSLFTKSQQQSNYQFGTGYSGWPKANFGTNNTYSFTVSSNSNTAVASSAENSLLSTPKSNKGSAAANDLTPVKISYQANAKTGMNRFGTPTAPQKGGTFST